MLMIGSRAASTASTVFTSSAERVPIIAPTYIMIARLSCQRCSLRFPCDRLVPSRSSTIAS